MKCPFNCAPRTFASRLTAEQALQHPYIAEYHDPSDEPTSEPFDDSFELTNLSVAEWKSKTPPLSVTVSWAFPTVHPFVFF